MDTAFFSDLLGSIAERGRGLLGLKTWPSDSLQQASSLVDLCQSLLTGKGEASGLALAREILDRYATLDGDGRARFFQALARDFGPDEARLSAIMKNWDESTRATLGTELHYASEPRRQELFRRLNRAPGGTQALVAMRADLLAMKTKHPEYKIIDRDFSHLLNSWFNRGFLVLRRIDWSTPAAILEKVIRYEAVHEIHDWNDLRRRTDPVDRRCYAFFHPALNDEPLIFVEVALTADIPNAIAPLLAENRVQLPLEKARTAVFYSISNCQKGLAGISFGNFLIKQVVEELRREFPKLETFVTLSPVPGFMAWVKSKPELPAGLPELPDASVLESGNWTKDADESERMARLLEPLAAHYFLAAKAGNNRPYDPVARFHLGNGARLERINVLGDPSKKGLREAAGLMVNYLYDLDHIEKNHEAFENQGEVVTSSLVRKMLKSDRLSRFSLRA